MQLQRESYNFMGVPDVICVQTGCPLAGGGTRVKLHSKFVWERFPTAIKIDRIPLFDVRPARNASKRLSDFH